MQTTYEINTLLHGLSQEDMRDVQRGLRQRTYRAGQSIFATHQEANSLYLVCEGLVRIGYIAPDGSHRILEFSEDGDIFGELFIGSYPFRIGEAYAVTNVTLYVLHEAHFYDLIRRYPQVGINFIRYQADSERRMFARMHALQHNDAQVRLIGTLVSLARSMCCTDGQQFVLNPAINQQDLANLTGLNRSTVSSLINRLRDDAVLGGTGRYLTVDIGRCRALLRADGIELMT